MKIVDIQTHDDLNKWMDQLTTILHDFAKRGAEGRVSGERVFRNMLGWLGRPQYMLIFLVEDSRLLGVLAGLHEEDTTGGWVDVGILWAPHHFWKFVQAGGWDHMLAWARSRGAKRITAFSFRHPKAYSVKFLQKLGFKVTGILLERELTNE